MSRSLGEKNATQSHIVIALVALLTQEVLADKPKVLPLTPPPLLDIYVYIKHLNEVQIGELLKKLK